MVSLMYAYAKWGSKGPISLCRCTRKMLLDEFFLSSCNVLMCYLSYVKSWMVSVPSHWLSFMTHSSFWFLSSFFTKPVIFYTQPVFCVSLPMMGSFLNILALHDCLPLFPLFFLQLSFQHSFAFLKRPVWGPEEWILLINLCFEKSKNYFSVSIGYCCGM